MTCVCVYVCGGYFLIKTHGISITLWNDADDFVYSSLIQLESKVSAFMDSFLLIENGPEPKCTRRGMMVVLVPLLSCKPWCVVLRFMFANSFGTLSNSLSKLQSVSFHCICSSCSGVSLHIICHHTTSFYFFLMLPIASRFGMFFLCMHAEKSR